MLTWGIAKDGSLKTNLLLVITVSGFQPTCNRYEDTLHHIPNPTHRPDLNPCWTHPLTGLKLQ